MVIVCFVFDPPHAVAFRKTMEESVGKFSKLTTSNRHSKSELRGS